MTERTPEMEHHDFDLRSRVVNLEHDRAGVVNRVTALELWKGQRDIADAVKDEQLRGIEKALTGIQSTLGRINWLLISGIVIGFVGFMLKGGIKLP